MRILLTAMGLALSALSALADPNPLLVAAHWQDWRALQGDPDSVLVVFKDGREFARVEDGLSADAPVDLQSNSKAITALCVQSLVAAGQLGWQQPLTDILPSSTSAITLAQLVTHSSGIKRDRTQLAMMRWRGETRPRWREVTQKALAQKPRGAAGDYVYNNVNYAVLGVVIETVTGQSYDSYCKGAVLRGYDSARLSDRVGSFGPWGGWQMSAADYARFHHASFAGKPPSQAPYVALNEAIGYGLGTLVRPKGAGGNYWHFGLLCFGGGRDDGGSYAVSWGQHWTVVAQYRRCISDKAMAALDRTMVEAVLLEK